MTMIVTPSINKASQCGIMSSSLGTPNEHEYDHSQTDTNKKWNFGISYFSKKLAKEV